jgi:hypothetical protein
MKIHVAVVLVVFGVLSTSTFAQTSPIATRVSALVNNLIEKDKELESLRALENLGNEGVPYLIGHLSDVRPIPLHEISLVNNSPDAFEGLRHYAPKTVHDALASILNQITGQHFEFVYNGASEATRKANLEQWRAWCIKTFPRQVNACTTGA